MEKYSHGLEQDVSVIDLIGRCDIVSIPIVVVAFLAARLLPLWSATVVGSVATIAATMLCLRGLVQRIGAGHRIVRMACRVPGGGSPVADKSIERRDAFRPDLPLNRIEE